MMNPSIFVILRILYVHNHFPTQGNHLNQDMFPKPYDVWKLKPNLNHIVGIQIYLILDRKSFSISIYLQS